MILGKVKAEHGSTANFNQKLKLQLMLQPLSYRADLARLQQHTPGTSECLRRIKEWVLKTDGSRCLCLLGGPGEGKSTVAAALCRMLEHGDLDSGATVTTTIA